VFVWKPPGRAKHYYRFRHPVTGQLVTRAGTIGYDATLALAVDALRAAANEAAGIQPSGHSKAPVLDHVQAFLDHLTARDRTTKHIATRKRHLTMVANGLGWKVLRDLSGSAAEKLLSDWRKGGGRFSSRTSNHYVRSLKHFGRWLVRDGRLTADPFAHLQTVNADADRRHVRRALEPAELVRLLDTTRASTRVDFGLTGPQRAVLYLAAARTGLRAQELASLTPASFDLRAVPPVWSVGAAADKARRGDQLPLFPELADALRQYLPGIKRGDRLWPGGWAGHGARMLRNDLKAAGIAYRTDDGVFDFHALRVQFITDMARAGISLQAAQRLARHCDPKLTSTIYSKLGRTDLADELAKLPRTLPG
jgi:integrase/recombinase XerD